MDEPELLKLRDEIINHLTKSLGVIFEKRSRVMISEPPDDKNLTALGNKEYKEGFTGTYLARFDCIALSPKLDKEGRRRILSHELGHVHNHYYLQTKNTTIDEFRRKIGVKELVSCALVDEGIGEYFSFDYLGRHKDFNIKDWPSRSFQLLDHLDEEGKYKLGYTLVKPTIDKYKEKGIFWMLENKLSYEELLEPQKYWLRAEKSLK